MNITKFHVEKLTSFKEIQCSSLKGYLRRLNDEALERLFGEPIIGDDKTTREWFLKINGILITIYDYRGDEWHIGGHGHPEIVCGILEDYLHWVIPSEAPEYLFTIKPYFVGG